MNTMHKNKKKRKSKVTPVTGLGSLQGCEMSRIPHCLVNRFIAGRLSASLTCPALPPEIYSGTNLCHRLSKPQSKGVTGRTRHIELNSMTSSEVKTTTF
jgi:hypothetical protein